MVVGTMQGGHLWMLQQNKKNVMDGHSIKIRIKIYTRSTLHIMYYVLLFIYDYLEKSVRKKKEI